MGHVAKRNPSGMTYVCSRLPCYQPTGKNSVRDWALKHDKALLFVLFWKVTAMKLQN